MGVRLKVEEKVEEVVEEGWWGEVGVRFGGGGDIGGGG